MCSTAPQSGDGAEILLAALQGGVLHPPGFPFQAWLNRALVDLPLFTLPVRLVGVCLLAHAAAVGVTAKICERLGAQKMGQFLAAVLFGFYPVLAAQAVQIEVFAIVHLFMALSLYCGVVLSDKRRFEEWDALLVAGTTGIGLAQHPVMICALPSFCVALFLFSRERELRWRRQAVSIGLLVLIVGGFYLSLPLLRTNSPWPDWGKLHTLRDIIRHMLREEYGIFDLHSIVAGMSLSGWDAFYSEGILKYGLTGFLILSCFGFFKIGRSPALVAVLGMLIAGAALVTRTVVHVPGYYELPEASAVIQRFQGPLLLALSVLAGIGFQRMYELSRGGRAPRSMSLLLNGSALILAGFFVFNSRDLLRESIHPYANLYQEALGLSIPKNALVLVSNDLEAFYGMKIKGKLQFGVVPDILHLPWYLDQTISKIDPRLHHRSRGAPHLFALLKKAYDQGLTIASTTAKPLMSLGRPILSHGLFYFVSRDSAEVLAQKSNTLPEDLCHLIVQLGPRPDTGIGHSLFIWSSFAGAFQGFADSSKQSGDLSRSKYFEDVVVGLDLGREPRVWKDACGRLASLDSSRRVLKM